MISLPKKLIRQTVNKDGNLGTYTHLVTVNRLINYIVSESRMSLCCIMVCKYSHNKIIFFSLIFLYEIMY